MLCIIFKYFPEHNLFKKVLSFSGSQAPSEQTIIASTLALSPFELKCIARSSYLSSFVLGATEKSSCPFSGPSMDEIWYPPPPTAWSSLRMVHHPLTAFFMRSSTALCLFLYRGTVYRAVIEHMWEGLFFTTFFTSFVLILTAKVASIKFSC